MSRAADYIKHQISETQSERVKLEGRLEGLYDALSAVERDDQEAADKANLLKHKTA